MNAGLRTAVRVMVTTVSLLLAAAAGRADVVVESGFGFGGATVNGAPAPIRIELLSNENEPITVSLAVRPPAGSGGVGGEGAPILLEAYLAPGARKRLTVPVRGIGGWNSGNWRLRISTDRRTLIRHGTLFEDGSRLDVEIGGGSLATGNNRVLDSGEPIIATLQDEGRLAWLQNVGNRSLQGGARPAARIIGERRFGFIQALVAAETEAPTTWLAWEGVDAVVWYAPRPEALGNDAAVDAVLAWAERGGRLVVVLTPDARVPPSSRLGAALPGIVIGWEEAAPGLLLGATIGQDPVAVPGATVPVATLTDVFGTVRRRLPDGRPLVIERAWGLGTLVLVTHDLARQAQAPQDPRFLLAAELVGPQAWSDAEAPWGGRRTDLDPTLNHMRRRFLKAPPLGLLVLGLVLYVLAIGPLDYFLLKKRNALRKTVYTFPLIVIGFTVIAWGGSFLLFGGNAGAVRVAWIDLATAGSGDADVVRGIDLLGIYSPTGATVELGYDVDDVLIDAPWLGQGATNWGDDAARIDGVVRIGPDGRAHATLDLPLRSFRAAEARWSTTRPDSLDARVIREDGRSLVEVRNTLAVPLHDAVLVHAGRVIELAPDGELLPGATVRVPLAPQAATGRAHWVAARDARAWRSLPWTFAHGGLMNDDTGEADAFVPGGETTGHSDDARRLMARAAMGATFTGLSLDTGNDSADPTRILARQGVDLSRAALEDRPIVLGWCTEDPLGVFPDDFNLVSAVYVVRRVLPPVHPADPEEGR